MESDSFAVWRLAVSDPRNSPEQRRDAVASWRHGHRRLTYDRLCWARGALQKGQPVSALKQLRHAAHSYLEYWRVPGVGGAARPANPPSV